MTPLAPLVDVPRADRPGHRRVAGLLPGNAAIAVATLPDGATQAETELTFELAEAAALAELVLAGDARAKTRPGLARILSATVAVLFRVATGAGAVRQAHDGADQHEGDDGRGDLFDRDAAAQDEDPDQ